MNQNFNSENMENDESNFNTMDSDYKSLMIRLKEISETINLLEKTIFS